MPITISNYRELLANLRKRPLMYLIREDFATVAAHIDGYDLGHNHALLTGFREWLVTQVGCNDQHVWWSLVAQLTPPAGHKSIRTWDAETDALAVETLFDLIDEFLELRDEHDGMLRIYAAYGKWRDLRKAHGCLASSADACPIVEWPRSKSRRQQP
jgi:hypothetical protein